MSPLGYHPILTHSAQNIRKTNVPNIKHQGKNGLLTISGTNSGYAPTSLGRGNTKIIEDNNEVVVDGYYGSVAIIQIVNIG